ncbi:MAG: putative peptidase [Gammaproteobacteria bacterium]|jgi:predicted peptidase
MMNPMFATAGIHETSIETESFGELNYTLSLPGEIPTLSNAASGKRFPLVVALHYGFDRSALFPRHYGRGVLEGLIGPALGELGAIIIAPDSHGKSWTDSRLTQGVLELATWITQHYPIDTTQTLLTGFSLGGIGTWHIMGDAKAHFSAAISVAAAPDSEVTARFPNRPLYVIHSEDDEVFPIAKVSAAVSALRERGGSVHFERIHGVKHFNVPQFVPALRNTLPWLRNVWAGT